MSEALTELELDELARAWHGYPKIAEMIVEIRRLRTDRTQLVAKVAELWTKLGDARRDAEQTQPRRSAVWNDEFGWSLPDDHPSVVESDYNYGGDL